MRTSTLCIAILLWVAIAGCDAPLELEQENNIASISLEVNRTSSNVNRLDWTPVDHPGFVRYWVLRTREPQEVILDTIDFVQEEVLATIGKHDQTSILDFAPVFQDGLHYQVYAEVNQRLIPGQTVPVDYSFIAFEGFSTMRIVHEEADTCFALQRSLTTGEHRLIRFNIQTGVVEKERAIIIGSQFQLAYGDFGIGKKELVIGLNNAALQFIDAVSFEDTYYTSSTWNAEMMIGLPNRTLAVVMDRGARLQAYSRATNRWGATLPLQGAFSSSNSFAHLFSDSPPLLIATSPDRIHRVSFDSLGTFEQDAYYKLPSNTNINDMIAIDPQLKYAMFSGNGAIYSLDDFRIVHTLPVTGSRNAAWGFSGTGKYIHTISRDFPSTISVADRSNFQEMYKQILPLQDRASGIININGTSYLSIQQAQSPRSEIITMLPG